ncbi:hypothetical protein [Azospirillum doebereinerae]
MIQISRIRFNALAGYSRHPRALAMGEEVGWYAHPDERLVAVLIRDREDGDYAGNIMVRDRMLRYRSVWVDQFSAGKDKARKRLAKKIIELSRLPSEKFWQADEKSKPINFYDVVNPQKPVHPTFETLSKDEVWSPARGLIASMMRYHEDPDHNFIEQFQTTAFDARLWELYLFAALTEAGYIFDREHAAPDLDCQGLFGGFTVEAVTVNPTLKDGKIISPELPDNPDELIDYRRNYLPTKFSGPLTNKLSKEYWKKHSHMAKRPFVIAIQDFHMPGAMSWSGSALADYLFGYRHEPRYNSDGTLEIIPERIVQHVWGTKVVQSGFFFLPEAENVSAVLWNAGGTLSKFNRMGKLAGFGSRQVHMTRTGTCVDHDLNAAEPLRFAFDVDAPDYLETWCEGMSVFHNPRALIPLAEYLVPHVQHHHLLPDGQIESNCPPFQPIGEHTFMTLIDAPSGGKRRAIV